MGQIKAIGFDFGGVIGGDPSLGHTFTRKSAELLGVTPEQWRSTYFSMNHLLNEGGTVDKVEFWRQFLTRFNQIDKLEGTLELDNELANHYMVINQDIIALVDQLRNAGYKVGLLSNASGEVASTIKSLGIGHHFDSFLFSAEIGLQKPDPKAFQTLAKSLGVDITELIFIDDAEKSLATAKECGFTPILFVGIEDLQNRLHEMGVTY